MGGKASLLSSTPVRSAEQVFKAGLRIPGGRQRRPGATLGVSALPDPQCL